MNGGRNQIKQGIVTELIKKNRLLQETNSSVGNTVGLLRVCVFLGNGTKVLLFLYINLFILN